MERLSGNRANPERISAEIELADPIPLRLRMIQSPCACHGLPGLLWWTQAGETTKMNQLVVVRATWDPEARVWIAESTSLPGLVTEASSLDELDRKLPGLIQDLMENYGEMEITVEVSFSKQVVVRSQRHEIT